jgi:hypothetical protein
MPSFIRSSLGVGLGALLFELMVRGLPQAKWGRVAFMVLVSLPLFWLYDGSKARRAGAKA